TRVEVVGNAVWDCPQAAFQLQDPGTESRSLLFANNTALTSKVAFRVWWNRPEDKVTARQVEGCNNLFLDAVQGDVLAFVGLKTGKGEASAALGRQASEAWSFHHNVRDGSGSAVGDAFPLGADRRVEGVTFVSRKASDAGYLRPAAGSKWAGEGAG